MRKLSVMPTLRFVCLFFFFLPDQVNNKLPFPLLFITSNTSSFSLGGFAFCSPWLVKPELLGMTVYGKSESRRSRARASGSRGAAWVLSFSLAGHALPLSQHSWTWSAVQKGWLLRRGMWGPTCFLAVPLEECPKGAPWESPWLTLDSSKPWV